jgi:hypothetical protein
MNLCNVALLPLLPPQRTSKNVKYKCQVRVQIFKQSKCFTKNGSHIVPTCVVRGVGGG